MHVMPDMLSRLTKCWKRKLTFTSRFVQIILFSFVVIILYTYILTSFSSSTLLRTSSDFVQSNEKISGLSKQNGVEKTVETVQTEKIKILGSTWTTKHQVHTLLKSTISAIKETKIEFPLLKGYISHVPPVLKNKR
jgi:hypothetical protein